MKRFVGNAAHQPSSTAARARARAPLPLEPWALVLLLLGCTDSRAIVASDAGVDAARSETPVHVDSGAAHPVPDPETVGDPETLRDARAPHSEVREAGAPDAGAPNATLAPIDCVDAAITASSSVCGNGILEDGEECDDGNLNSEDGCSWFCYKVALPVCANGVIEAGEWCDDGNLLPHDGCNDACFPDTVLSAPECGNAIVETGEQCDDGVVRDCNVACPETGDDEAGIGSEGTGSDGTGSDGTGSDESAADDESTGETGGSSNAAPDAGDPSDADEVCRAPRCACPTPGASNCCAEALAYRTEVIGDPGTVTDQPVPPVTPATDNVTRGDLWATFQTGCGTSACHVGDGDPNASPPLSFKVTEETFNARATIGTDSLALITSGDPTQAMPFGLGAGDQRECNDRWRRLGETLLAWQQSGFADQFGVEKCEQNGHSTGPIVSGECGPGAAPYRVVEAVANAETNIGSCLPSPNFLSQISCSDDYLKQKDAVFEQAVTSDDLPAILSDTDLISLDSAVLARNHVFSYAPAYTLFSDDAKKQRYVRVPFGKTIAYNAAKQNFDIPDNTRFYKTFLRRVVERDGHVGYRKMETRLIVVRRDEEQADGSFKPRALRATYAWSKDERQATLVTDQLRNGKAWGDRLCPYVTDENQTRDPELNPIISNVSTACTYMTADERTNPSSGSIRHYAIPSAERCDQCHMGSSSRSYILGFTPWHADRRALGEGGVWEAPNPDDLGQLQRLLDYGVVTGLQPGQAKLEEAELPRKPRNAYELTAQAYMMSNCAFCHNPNGFPVAENPALLPFDLMPRQGDHGGIFQFPLDLTSPRAKLGQAQAVPLPYITSIVGNPALLGGGPESNLKRLEISANRNDVKGWDQNPLPKDLSSDEFGDWLELYAPWRSLIWRNTYTPFTYYDQSAIFIHMPRNTPGFDCRANQIMADWMLSIPSQDANAAGGGIAKEILPTDDGYASAVADAEARRQAYHDSVTGQNCPLNDDTVDRYVLEGAHAYPTDTGIMHGPRVSETPALLSQPDDPIPFGYLQDAVPDHAHWIPLDVTDLPGQWLPRRHDWREMLTQEIDPRAGLTPGSAEFTRAERLARTIEQLSQVHLSDAQEHFSLDPVPLGLWSQDCSSSDVSAASPTVAQARSQGVNSMARWLLPENADPGEQLDPERRVHSMSRGEAVFGAICRNCHGANYDSRSPLAATISELTGGQTRVANFRDGLLGPVGDPGAYSESVFTFSDGNNGATPQEWQARYMLFMGLGGTLAELPAVALNLVAGSPFYGHGVTAASAGSASAGNMLQPAQGLCRQLLASRDTVLLDGLKLTNVRTTAANEVFAHGTGHFELWESLCTYQNDPLVRVLRFDGTHGAVARGVNSVPQLAQYYRTRNDDGSAIYPEDALVGDVFGKVQAGIQPENVEPWCILRDDAHTIEIESAFAAANVPADGIPYCPETLFAHTSNGVQVNVFDVLDTQQVGPLSGDEYRERWYSRGAMNAGLAVYYYLDRLSKAQITPSLPFDSASCVH